jgi:hypothetical protein
MHLQEGQLITAPFLAGTAEVKRFEPRAGYYRLEVVLQDGRQTYKPLQIAESQLLQSRAVDASGDNHSFDVRFTHCNPDGAFAHIRHIEVKARAWSGAVRISVNEWKKARHLDEEYWLYIATEAVTDEPQLHPIQDPAAQFQRDEDIFVTGFIIPEESWRSRAESLS